MAPIIVESSGRGGHGEPGIGPVWTPPAEQSPGPGDERGEYGRVNRVRRLHWGCGRETREGWINSDRQGHPGVDMPCDIREGLPLDDASVDYAVSIHALQEIPFQELGPVLGELRRVLKTGGVLRLGLPDLLKGVEAYHRQDTGYFLVPDEDARHIGAKLVVQLLWYGHSRMVFTPGFIEESLLDAEFRRVVHCRFGQTENSYPDITVFDDRERESLFVEAVK